MNDHVLDKEILMHLVKRSEDASDTDRELKKLFAGGPWHARVSVQPCIAPSKSVLI